MNYKSAVFELNGLTYAKKKSEQKGMALDPLSAG